MSTLASEPARAWRFGDNVNTDLILPGPFLRAHPEVQARQVFSANRPGWVDQIRAGDVIVAGRNFGMGSARPAQRSFKRLGLGFLVAEQVNSLFFRGCVNFGFLALDCPGVTQAFAEGDAIAFDREAWLLRNLTTGIAIPPAPLAPQFLRMMTEGGLFPMLEAEGLLAPEAPWASA